MVHSRHARVHLTDEEWQILIAKQTEENDEAYVKWPKVKWIRQHRRNTFKRKRKHAHPGTAIARCILKGQGQNMKVCEGCGLNDDMSIHHIDENPNNNSPSNLQVLCRSCHGRRHDVTDLIGVKEWYYGTKLEE